MGNSSKAQKNRKSKNPQENLQNINFQKPANNYPCYQNLHPNSNINFQSNPNYNYYTPSPPQNPNNPNFPQSNPNYNYYNPSPPQNPNNPNFTQSNPNYNYYNPSPPQNPNNPNPYAKANLNNNPTKKKSLGNSFAIGIDLGTCFCTAAVWKNNSCEIIPNEFGMRTTPSYISFTNTGRLIGEDAKNQTTRNPFNTIFNTKRLIGRKFFDPIFQKDKTYWPFSIEKDNNEKPMIVVTYKGETKNFYAEEISAMLLAKIKENAEDYLKAKITNACITVPANFNHSQRQATKNAGIIAGLNVLRIISEPSAAAVLYAMNSLKENKKTEKNVIVFDFGGGTLDVALATIYDGLIEIKAISGNSHLGGEDFDDKLVEWCAAEFFRKTGLDIRINPKALRRLRIQCEKAKRILSSSKESIVEVDALAETIDFCATITRQKFEELCQECFDECISQIAKVLKDAAISKENINDIIIVGGSSRIPKISEIIKGFFNGKEVNRSLNFEESVAIGAGIQAVILTNSEDVKLQDLLLLDVVSHSIGIEIANGVFNVLIAKNTTIPAKISKTFSTFTDNQTELPIHILEGESKIAKENLSLGFFIVGGIERAPKGVPQIEVTVAIDENGIIDVSAVCKSSGNKNKMTITNDKDNISKMELKRMKIDAEKMRIEDNEERKKNESKNNLENYVISVRSKINECITGDSDKIFMEAICKDTEEWLNMNQEMSVEQYELKLKDLKKSCDKYLLS